MWVIYQNAVICSRVAERNDFDRERDRLNSAEKRPAEIAETAGVNLVGDYEQRLSGFSPGGEFACAEFGDTSHFRRDCPVYLDKQVSLRWTPNGVRKGGMQPERGKKRERKKMSM